MPQIQSPSPARIVILVRSFAATGRGWRHPTFTCRRPAPGRRARWLEIQGPVSTGSGEAASNGGGAEARLQWLKAATTPPRDRTNRGDKRTAKERHGSQDAATRAPKGNPFAEGESPPSVAE